MSEFKKKRNELELFVREQIIGPGSFNKRFHFIEDLRSENLFYDFEIINQRALNNDYEVIPEVPAYQYSSAILYPQTKRSHSNVNQQNDNDERNSIDESLEHNTSNDDENNVDDISESLISKQQNYPNEFGLSFVVNQNTDFENDLSVKFLFRKYFQIKKRECLSKKIAIWIPENSFEISNIINLFFNSIFKAENIKGNDFVYIIKEFNENEFYDIDYIYLNNYLTQYFLPKLKSFFVDKIIQTKKKNDIEVFGIKYEDKNIDFFSVGGKTYKGKEYADVITLYDNGINFIKDQLGISASNYLTYRELIKEFEIYHQIKAIVTDIKSIFKINNATPIWQSKPFSINIKLPNYDNSKTIIRFKELNFDESELVDLKYSIQYLKKEGLIYCKILVQNKAYVELKENEPPMLNKKDVANIKAFFGVKLEVSEKNIETLQSYNPPQLLNIDEEDNFNKILYRNFLDYGEGYNTSVTWGKNVIGMKYIATEFLPEQETPKVDFKPSKLLNGQVVSRISNEQILSIRYLSTLSLINDEEIILGLRSFISDYENWIIEKKQELKSNDTQFNLLSKQLKACEEDYNRLNRNISLLEYDKKALTAFRLMNTAMFMQLHHSVLKKNKSLDLFNKLNENYYKSVELTEDYKWRSFQLAFVLLNIDAFVKPEINDKTVEDVFGNGWPERNEIADLVWFPTGGGKTEAYLGIIAFCISYRRFTKGQKGYGTSALMRYTLRLLTLQQFQRATLLICALETIRKDFYYISNSLSLGEKRITIGLFVGSGSLPNKWNDGDNSMYSEFNKISNQISNQESISTNLPFTECPWCGSKLFFEKDLENIFPNHTQKFYRIEDELAICCNNHNCTFSFSDNMPVPDQSLPLRLFDEDIYKFPPTLLFGTVDKFAALANNISRIAGDRNKDSRRLFGQGYNQDCFPPELIIQDELHLLLGPLGTAVGLFE